jgi:LuxR family quorum sensing-dependent transcriptional regulator
MEQWLTEYHGEKLVDDCAFSKRTQRGLMPFTWDEGTAADPEGTRDVVLAAESFGLQHGLHVPVALRDGFHGAVFIQLDRAELDEDERSILTFYALAAHNQLQALHSESVLADTQLSEREREVLRWFAEGKSCEDVASIVGISPATVMFHYRNVAQRFGTLNRTHTVVEAINRGAITLS